MLLPLYGGFAAATDGVGKVWVSGVGPPSHQGGAPLVPLVRTWAMASRQPDDATVPSGQASSGVFPIWRTRQPCSDYSESTICAEC